MYKKISKIKFKILDIGCGPAEILDYIPECEYYGYDIDKRAINFARKNIQIIIIISFVKNLMRVNYSDYQNLIS